MAFKGATTGDTGGLMAAYRPVGEAVRRRWRWGLLDLSGHVSFPALDAIRDAVAQLRAGSLPRTTIYLGTLLVLYPCLVAALVLLGWSGAERFAAWAPVVLVAAVLCSALVSSLHSLFPCLRHAFHTALYGLLAALSAGLFTKAEPGLTWPWWIVLFLCWLLSVAVGTGRPSHAGLSPGEHRVTASGDAKREVISDPALRLCIISAMAAEVEVDLRGCGIAENPAVIDLDVWFSTITLRINPFWTMAVIEDKILMLSTYDAKEPVYPPPPGLPPHLAMRGSVLFSKIIYRY